MRLERNLAVAFSIVTTGTFGVPKGIAFERDLQCETTTVSRRIRETVWFEGPGFVSGSAASYLQRRNLSGGEDFRPSCTRFERKGGSSSMPDLNQFTQAIEQSLTIADKFRGSNPVAYRLNDDGSLSYADAYQTRSMVTMDASKPPPIISVAPQYFYGPDIIFNGLDKVQAYVKVSVRQSKVQVPLSKQLSWTAILPLLTDSHENITPTPITLTDDEKDALSTIPLPSGKGELIVSVMALVGPPAKTAWTIIDSTFKRLASVAESNEGSSLLVIPAADLVVAKQVEALVQSVVNAFQSDTVLQYWTRDDDNSIINLTLTNPTSSEKGDGGGVVLAEGDTVVIVTPDQTNPGDPLPSYLPIDETSEGTRIGSYTQYLQSYIGKKFSKTRDGVIAFGESGTNPFDGIPYVTMTLTASTANATIMAADVTESGYRDELEKVRDRITSLLASNGDRSPSRS